MKIDGRWRLAGEEPGEPDEAAMPKPEPEDSSRWVRPDLALLASGDVRFSVRAIWLAALDHYRRGPEVWLTSLS